MGQESDGAHRSMINFHPPEKSQKGSKKRRSWALKRSLIAFRRKLDVKNLRFLVPRTVAQQVGLSFAVIVMPLVLALIVASVYVDNAMKESQKAILLSTEGVRHSLTLANTLRDMERSARVYQVMGDERLLATYERLRAELIYTIKQLYKLDIETGQISPISYLLNKEQSIHSALSGLPAGSPETSAAIENFTDLRKITDTLIQTSSMTVETKVNAMKQAGATARAALLVEAAAAIVVALFLALMVIPRIFNYARALDRSIHQLGVGNLKQKISLKGPRDIRELGARLEWLREQLNLLESQKQHFLQHVSHELKTPLSSIREGACLLSDDVPGVLNKEQREIIEILQRNCGHLQRQIEGLLEFSANMQPFQPKHQQRARLDEQIFAITTEHTLQIRAKALRVTTELESLVIFEDTTQINTVLDNLISNAVKFTTPGGGISIKAYKDRNNAVVEVENEGPGIAVHEHDRIFDAFYKISVPHRPSEEGSGLGLSIAKLYAKSHGGDIEVAESQIGALFRLTLPMEAAAP